MHIHGAVSTTPASVAHTVAVHLVPMPRALKFHGAVRIAPPMVAHAVAVHLVPMPRALAEGWAARHTDVFLVHAIVVAPAAEGAALQPRLTSRAVNLVHPDWP